MDLDPIFIVSVGFDPWEPLRFDTSTYSLATLFLIASSTVPVQCDEDSMKRFARIVVVIVPLSPFGRCRPIRRTGHQ